MSDKKPDIYMMPKKDGLIKLKIRNAGIAGNVLQFRITKGTVEFVRVIPPNNFAGTYNDPAIAKSEKIAKKTGKHAFITNNVLVSKEDAEFLSKEIQKVFTEIWKLVKSGGVRKVRKPRQKRKV